MGQIEIDEETNKRLLRKIDRRVLTFMVATYFLQAIDKGTLSFTSIMNIRQDTHLVGQQVCIYTDLVREITTDRDGISTPGSQHVSTLPC